MQSLVGRGKCKTFHLFHRHSLRRHRHLFLLNGQTARISTATYDFHFLQLGVLRIKVNLEGSLVAYRDNLGLVTHIREHQFVLRALHLHGEVTIEVGLRGRHDTVVSIALYHVTHHDRAFVVSQRTRYAHALCRYQLADDSEQGGKYDFLDIHCIVSLSS